MTPLPMLPQIDAFETVQRIAASQAERLLQCPLRFLLDQSRALRRMQPYSAAALVGTAAHSALAALTHARGSGLRNDAPKDTRDVARRTFDQALTLECNRRDQGIAARGELPGDSTEAPFGLPFYSMTRARLARLVENRFGPTWIWGEPSLVERARTTSDPASTPSREIGPELRIKSSDGLVVGVADSVEQHDGAIVIEELKSGEATAERLAGWRYQLLVYGYLYREQFGRAPSVLRVRSLPDGTRDFAYDENEAAEAVGDMRNALAALNARLAAGATAAALARPSEATCAACPHRPWCEPYWAAGPPALGNADVEGTLAEIDGWKAVLTLSSGAKIPVDFRASGLALRAGTRVRICGARPDPDGALRCTRITSVWRISV